MDTIRHRGPDDEGIYLAPQVGLGFVRLSIIDLASGHQPLSNEDGTIWIVFQRGDLQLPRASHFFIEQGACFQDTERHRSHCASVRGIRAACVEKLRGMFAFALWDENTKTLLLARDRVGIKASLLFA